MDHVLAKEKVVLDQVPDKSAEKGDICSGPDRHPDVGERARPRKSWIDMDNGRAALLCFHDPAKTDRVRLGHRRAFD